MINIRIFPIPNISMICLIVILMSLAMMPTSGALPPRDLIIDKRITIEIPNQPPYTPSSPSPGNTALNISISLILSWSGGDPDGDTVTYIVYLDESSNPTTQECSGTSTSCSISGLSYNNIYYWKVVANDGINSPVNSPVWSFTTQLPPTLTSTVRSGHLFDLNNGMETSNIDRSSDFWWGQLPSGERYLVPKNDATFAIIGVVDFETMNCSSVSNSSYSSAKINGSIDNNQIPTGTVICAKTHLGNYAKFKIDSYGYDLRISWLKSQYEYALALTVYSIVSINSIPQGAQIRMDGENTEKLTPDEFGPINEGNHTYELLLSGYLPYNDSFYIPSPSYKAVSIDKDVPLQTLTPTPTPTLTPTPTPTPIPATPTVTASKNSATMIAVMTTSAITSSTPTAPVSIASVSTVPTPVPGFLVSSLLIAVFFVYLFMFKNRRR